jgi:hypothetical protein
LTPPQTAERQKQGEGKMKRISRKNLINKIKDGYLEVVFGDANKSQHVEVRVLKTRETKTLEIIG